MYYYDSSVRTVVNQGFPRDRRQPQIGGKGAGGYVALTYYLAQFYRERYENEKMDKEEDDAS